MKYVPSGVGATNHLAMDILRAVTGLNATHVPYRGGLVTLQAIVSNEVQMCIEGILTVPAFLAEGKLRAITVTGAERSALMPDVPAVAETVPGFDAGAQVMLFAPAGTPAPSVGSSRPRRGPPSAGRRSGRGWRRSGPPSPAPCQRAAAIHRQELEKWRRAVEVPGDTAG